MFRITYSQAVSDAWRNRTTLPEVKQRRIYCWGTLWGFCSPCAPWSAERRTIQEDTEEYRVERCEIISCDRLPMEMDDIWEEDVCTFPKGLDYTGLVSIKGEREQVLETAAAHGLPTPSLPFSANAAKPQVQKLAKAKAKSRCLIADDTDN